MELFTGAKPFIELKRAELLKIKNQEALIPIIYSEVVSLLKQKYDNDYILNRLRQMGYKLAEGLLKYWKPKELKSVPKIVQETYGFFLYRKISIEKRFDQIYVRDPNCPVCYLDISDSDIPFCIVISAMIENLINSLRRYNRRLPEIECKTLASRSMGAELCEHVIEIKRV